MFRRLQTTALAAILLTNITASTVSGATGSPQRRHPRPNSSTGPATPLDGFGPLVQPESVRSILLLYLARNVSKAKAGELEADLRSHPDNIDDRLSLIGYYSWNGRTPGDRLRLRTHVLWMIDNHPEHPATAEPALRDLPDDPDGNVQILEVWTKNLEIHKDDYNVLKNAEKFFFSRNPSTAEALVRRLGEKDPSNRTWPNELAKLYSMFGIPDYPSKDPAETATEAYKRVLELTRDPHSRESLAGDMAEADFKAGNLSGAAALARIHLQSSDRSAIQRANTLLGRVALRSDDMSSAKQYLLDSGKPDVGRYVSLSGPTMILAKELLEKGQRDIVVEYLEECLTLWPHGEDILRIWISDIQNGRTPDFGNLSL